MADKFLYVDLQESKHLSKTLANDTSRKILEYLSKHSRATESSLSSKLKIPLSTVHYNLNQLIKGGLVKADEYHYSQKGREVSHYELASPFIVISAVPTFNLKEKLIQVLPMTLIAGGVAWWLQSMQKLKVIPTQITNILPKEVITKTVYQEAVDDMAYSAGAPIMDASMESAPQAARLVAEPTMQAVTQSATSTATEKITETAVIHPEPIGLYFFAGFLIAVALYLAWDYYKSK